jgi:hypothetical protein
VQRGGGRGSVRGFDSRGFVRGLGCVVGGGRWVADKGESEGKEARGEPRCMHHVGFGGLGVDLGADRGGVGSLVGSLVGAWGGRGGGRRGRRQGRKGGPLHFHRPTPKNGSYAVRRKFCAFLLGDVHRSRTRNTRGACDENDKDEIWSQREKCRLECSSTNLDTKTHRPFFSRRLYTAIKNPDENKVYVAHDMRYKRIMLLVMARCHDVSTGRHWS